MSVTTLELEDRVVPAWGGSLDMHVKVAGSGPPIVYLHAAGGPDWDAFLDRLATRHTVYAPEHPGTGDGDPDAIEMVEDLWDLVLIYEEVIRALEFASPPVCIGQSLGGMLAAELAASFPDLFSKLVLLAPAGLWREDLAPREWLSSPPEELPQRLFRDPSSPEAQAFFAVPDDPAAALEAQVRAIWAMGCMGKFAWPIPDRGLDRRLHRVAAPTLVVWGDRDDILPAGYAADWKDAIADSTVAIVPDSGHVVQVEQREKVLQLVSDFIDSDSL